MKKLLLPIITITTLLFLIIISNMTKISLENTWLGMSGLVILLAPWCVFGWIKANELKRRKSTMVAMLIKSGVCVFIFIAVVNILAWMFSEG